MFVKSLALVFFLIKLGCGESISYEYTTSVTNEEVTTVQANVLQRVDRSGKGITSEYLEKYAEEFAVEEVDLSNNEITKIKDIFDKVKTLNLTGNKNLEMPENSTFLSSNNLETLILADCGLKMIPDLAFSALPNLKRLDISGNDIDLSNFREIIQNLKNAEIEVIVSNIKEDNLMQLCRDYNLIFEIKSSNRRVSCNEIRSEKLVEKPSQAEYLSKNNENSEEMVKDNSTHAETNDGNIDMANDSQTTDGTVTVTTIETSTSIIENETETQEVTYETTLASTTVVDTDNEKNINENVRFKQPVSHIDIITQMPPKDPPQVNDDLNVPNTNEDSKIIPKNGTSINQKTAQSDENQKELNDTSSEAKEDPAKESNASSTIIYVIIGVGVVVFAVFGYLYYKKKHSYSTVTTEENEGKELKEIHTIKHEESNGEFPKPNISENKPLMYGEQKEETTEAPNMYGDKKPESFEEETKPVRFPLEQDALTYTGGSVINMIDDDVRKSMIENTDKSQTENETQEDSSK